MPTLKIVTVYPTDNSYNNITTPTFIVTASADFDDSTVLSNPPYLTNTSDRTVVEADEVVVENGRLYFTVADPLDALATYAVIIPVGVADVLGGTLAAPYIWTITTADVEELVSTAITSPINYELVASGALAIVFSRVADATQYTVQISQSRAFDGSIEREVTQGSTSTLTTGLIDDSLLSSGTYYARVRVENDETYSSWSDAISFVYNVSTTVDGGIPSYGPTWEVPAASFRITTTSPAAGAYNSNPSSIIIVFNNALPDEIAIYPTIDTENILTGESETNVGTEEEWSVSETGKVLTWVPTDGFVENTLYTLDFSGIIDENDNALAEDVEYSFTTTFSVLYATPSRLRAKLGTAVADIDNDELAYQLFLASISVNRADLDSTDLTTISEPQTVTENIITRTVLLASYAVVQRLIAEIAVGGNYTDRLGDYSIQKQFETLKYLQSTLDDITNELNSLVSGTYSIKSEDVPVILDGPTITARSTF